MWRRRRWIAMSQQIAQKAGSARRLLPRLLHLLLLLRHLRLGLFQRNVLNQHGLRQNVQRILISTQLAVQQRFRVRVFFLQLCLVYPLCERVQKLFFLGSHLGPTSGSRRLIAFAASQD